MKNTIYLTLLGLGLLLFSCKGGESNVEESNTDSTLAPTTTKAGDIDYDEMAKEFCQCMEPMFEFQNKLMKVLENGDETGVEAMRDEAMQVQKDGESCIMALEAKFGVVEGAEAEEKATKALEKACPEIMELMMGGSPESMEQ
ncbi:MAG: hypothetical protein AAFZ15_15030 [Bacteroidota bacterium]